MPESARLRGRIAELEAVAVRQQATATALEASEIRYRRLFEAARDGVLILDAGNGEIVAVNPFLIDLLGYTEQELVGLKLWEIGFFADKVDSKAAFQELQRHGYIRYDDLPLETKNGRSVSVEFVSNVYVAGGKQVIQCNIRDITERKRAEHELRQSREHLQLISENVLDLVAQISTDGTFLYLSHSYESVLGYSPQRLQGTSAFELLHPDEREPVLAAFADALQRGEGRAEFRYRHSDGHYLWLDARGKAFVDATGAPGGIVLSTRDITDRKQGEARRRQTEERFRTIFEEAPLGMAVTDSITGTIAEVNRRFAQIAGRTPDELVGIDWMSITHPDDVQEDLSNMARMNAGQIFGFNTTKRYRRPDGSDVWINMTIAPFADDGTRRPHHVCMIEDMSQRKAADELRRLQSAALNAAGDAIVITDRAGVIVWVNPAFTQLTGYAAE
ncbi:MAG: PAS domain S-box protein, partial [Vicinamibacterales bacterium]